MNFYKVLFLALCWTTLSHAAIRVAVTVDDLPSASALPAGVTWKSVVTRMLSALKQHKVPEVYGFLNGGKISAGDGSLEVLQLWRAAGYPLGNHAFLHEDLDKVSLTEFERAIDNNEPLLKTLNGSQSWKYFRYPFLHEGATEQKRNGIRRHLKRRGYEIAQVSIDFEDWAWNPAYTRCKDKADAKGLAWLEKVYLENAAQALTRSAQLSKALFKRDIAHILLLHIGGFGAEMYAKLLSLYEANGVTFIPLSEAVRDKVYSIDPGVTGPWGAEFPYQVLKARKLTLKDVGLAPADGSPMKELEALCR
jgi:peptidoglycan-N-acetylglucosamine deacetylase